MVLRKGGFIGFFWLQWKIRSWSDTAVCPSVVSLQRQNSTAKGLLMFVIRVLPEAGKSDGCDRGGL